MEFHTFAVALSH